MVEINLLPWRDDRRKKKNKELGLLLICGIVITLLFLSMFHYFLACWIGQENNRVLEWQQRLSQISAQSNNLKSIDQQQKKYQLAVHALQRISANQNITLEFFNAIFATLSADIYFDELSRQGNKVTLKGSATSALVLHEFMKKSMYNRFLNQSQLAQVKNPSQTAALNFQLKIIQDENAKPST